MKADFDKAAPGYDASFTHSVIGKLQRGLVYQQLSKVLQNTSPKKILEINCGTGEDALWLAQQGFTVLATDISSEMIAVAKAKITSGNPTFLRADIREIAGVVTGRFDLVFSNFGGLNCLPPIALEEFFESAGQILDPGGQLVLVIMPKNTLWERLYFTFKRDPANASRRKKSAAIANVEGENITTYYYNPKDIVHLTNGNFAIQSTKPIGFFIPPSYLENFFSNRPKLMAFLNAAEQKVKNISRLSRFADHYIIVLQKK